MKNLLILCLLALSFVPSSFAGSSPTQPEVDKRLNNIEKQTGTHLGYVRQARFVYQPAVQGGTAGSTYGLGVYLPAKSTILRGWITIASRFDAGGTVALKCEDAGNLLAATDLSIANYTNGTVIRLIPQDTLATVVKGTTIAARCQISATIATTTQANGKMVGWVEYFVSE